jgi:signal transduction histidine kinase
MDEQKRVPPADGTAVDAVDRDRRRLADELHDGLGQTLVSVNLLASMGSRLAQARADAGDPLREQLARITSLSHEATERVRGLSRTSAPALPRQLSDTLHGAAEDVRLRHQIRTSCALPGEALPAMAAASLRQIYLAISDIVCHLAEQLTLTAVDLYADLEEQHLELAVSAASEEETGDMVLPDGHCMQLAAYRIKLLGGTMRTASGGHRVRISLRLPL